MTLLTGTQLTESSRPHESIGETHSPASVREMVSEISNVSCKARKVLSLEKAKRVSSDELTRLENSYNRLRRLDEEYCNKLSVFVSCLINLVESFSRNVIGTN